MKHFGPVDARDALAHAIDGGQALLDAATIDVSFLIDQDYDRLIEAASLLGMTHIDIMREGHPGQHIVLAGEPKRRAIQMCLAESEKANP